ncbi:MAG TPA: O-antigen ligase domain-containing protein [Bacteroidetes bacterium]|nr:O-antigen ligase domain-containing protein [Bacteroidota bacterium]
MLAYTGLFLWLGHTFQGGLHAVQYLLKVLTVVALVQSVVGLVQFFVGWLLWIPPEMNPPYAFLGVANYFGETMLLLFVVAGATAVLHRGIWRWLGIAAALLTLVAGFSARSTAVNIGFGIVLLLAGFCLLAIGLGKWRKQGLPWYLKGRARLLVLLLLLVGGALGGYALRKEKLTGVAVADVRNTNDSEVERLVLWRETLRLAVERPVLGVGAGNWRFHILENGVCSNFQGFATRFFQRAHNDFLQNLAERGWPGGLAFLALFLLSFVFGWRFLEQKAKWEDKILVAMGLCGLGAWLVLASFAFPMERPLQFALLFFFFSAISIGIPQKWNREYPSFLLPLILLPTSIGLVGLSGLMMQSDQHAMLIMQARIQQNWPVVIREAEAAQQWYYPVNFANGTPLSWYIGTGYLLQGGNLASFSHLQKAHHIHPWHPHVGSNYAAALHGQGAVEECKMIMEDLLITYPEFHEVRINLNELYLQEGNRNKVNENLSYWENNTKPNHYSSYLKQVKEKLGGQ